MFEANSIAKVPGKNYFGVWWGIPVASGFDGEQLVDHVDVVDGVGDEMVHWVPWCPNNLKPNLEMINR